MAPGALSPFQALLSGQCSLTAQGLTDQVADGGGAGGCHLLEVGSLGGSDTRIGDHQPGRCLLWAVGLRHGLAFYGFHPRYRQLQGMQGADQDAIPGG